MRSKEKDPATSPFAYAMVSTVAGGFGPHDKLGDCTQACFYWPTHAIEDTDGSILVSDTGNHKVKRISPGHQVDLVAGTIWGYVDGPVASARVTDPSYMVLAPDGSIYVSDGRKHVIRRIVPGACVETIAGTPKRGYTELSRDWVKTFDHRGWREYTRKEWDSGAVEFHSNYCEGAVDVARFGKPAGLILAPDGTLLVADEDTNVIRAVVGLEVITVAGKVADDWPPPFGRDGQGVDARLHMPSGMCSDPEGGVLFTERSTRLVRRLGKDYSVSKVGHCPARSASGLGWNNKLAGIAQDRHGNIFVACESEHRIACLTPAGAWFFLGDGEPGHVDSQADIARFRYPKGLSIDARGNLLVADSGNHAIRRVVLTLEPKRPERSSQMVGTGEAICYEARRGCMPTTADVAPHTYLRAWADLMGKTIEFVESLRAESAIELHLGAERARIGAVGIDPMAYLANDGWGNHFHPFPDHIVGQQIQGLRIRFDTESVRVGLAATLQLQFAGGGFQYVVPYCGDGLKLWGGTSLLPEARTIFKKVSSIERPSPRELNLVVGRGLLTITSADEEPLEVDCCSPETFQQMRGAIDEGSNPYAESLGLLTPPELLFRVHTAQPEDPREEPPVRVEIPSWHPFEPAMIVGRIVQMLDYPLVSASHPKSRHVLLVMSGGIVLRVRSIGAGLQVAFGDEQSRPRRNHDSGALP